MVAVVVVVIGVVVIIVIAVFVVIVDVVVVAFYKVFRFRFHRRYNGAYRYFTHFDVLTGKLSSLEIHCITSI